MGWVNFVTVWLTFWEEVLDDEAGGRAVIAEGVALSLRDRELRQPNQGGRHAGENFFAWSQQPNPRGRHAGQTFSSGTMQQPNHGVARRQ